MTEQDPDALERVQVLAEKDPLSPPESVQVIVPVGVILPPLRVTVAVQEVPEPYVTGLVQLTAVVVSYL